jgi:hypothetical protein
MTPGEACWLPARHFREAGPEPIPPERFTAASNLRDAVAGWHEWLTSERRCSPHTIAAYGRYLAAFWTIWRGRTATNRLSQSLIARTSVRP